LSSLLPPLTISIEYTILYSFPVKNNIIIIIIIINLRNF
jgi:hypothetical protein